MAIQENYEKGIENRGSYFANRTKTGSSYDVKNIKDGAFLYSDKNYNETMTQWMLFEGEAISAEELGNIYLGFAGAARGFDLGTLQVGAGIYQAYSDIKQYFELQHGINSFFDDPRDKANIAKGYYLYFDVMEK